MVPYDVRCVGEIELIVLDSMAISAAQTDWLRRTLARAHGGYQAGPPEMWPRKRTTVWRLLPSWSITISVWI